MITVTFLIDPLLRPLGNRNEWELVDNFTVRIEEDGKPAEIVTVPRGFTTDLASVPRLPGAYLLFANRARRSAILHDYLYSQHRPRKWADAVFNAAMKNEVSFLPRFFMWLGVRIGGGAYYEDVTSQPPLNNQGEAP